MICPATPQRTAERRRVAPTPTMAPVMACVVLTGTPVWVARRKCHRCARLRGKAAYRLQLRDSRSHRVNDAPAAGQRSEGDGGVCDQHDPERNVKRLDVPSGEQDARDDSRRLLRIVGAVIEAEEGGRHELEPPEPSIDA